MNSLAWILVISIAGVASAKHRDGCERKTVEYICESDSSSECCIDVPLCYTKRPKPPKVKKVYQQTNAIIAPGCDNGEYLRQIECVIKNLCCCLVKVLKNEGHTVCNDIIIAIDNKDDKILHRILSDIGRFEAQIEKRILDEGVALTNTLTSISDATAANEERALRLIAQNIQNDLVNSVNALALQPAATIVAFVTAPTGLAAELIAATNQMANESSLVVARFSKEELEAIKKAVASSFLSIGNAVGQAFRRLEKRIKRIISAGSAEAAKVILNAVDKYLNAALSAIEAQAHRALFVILFLVRRILEITTGVPQADTLGPLLLLNGSSVNTQ